MIFLTRGAIYWVSIVTSGALLAMAYYYWTQVTEESPKFTRRWFKSWLFRGLAVPIAVWIYMNLGRAPLMPPLLRQIKMMRAYNQWGEALAAQACVGLMVLTIFWAALTFAWFMAGLLSTARNQEDILLAAFLWSPVALLGCLGFGLVFGWTGVALGAALGLCASTHYALAEIDSRPVELRYGGAIAKMKMGKYAEAELAIISELEKCETHFNGWLLLAEIYAIHFHDMAEAERTIYELCQQPETGLSEISIALHRLADWQLKLRNDPAAAQRALHDICTRMPGTHLDTMARHRIRQLAGGNPELDEQQRPRVIAMPKTPLRLDATEERLVAEGDREKALAAADACVEKLKQDPNDHASREQLARIFAERLGQVDLALEQMELLLETVEQLPGKAAEWLGLMANWVVKYRDDREQGRQLWRRIIAEFPQSAQAFEAQRRLSMMEMEDRVRRRRPQPSSAEQTTEAGAAAT